MRLRDHQTSIDTSRKTCSQSQAAATRGANRQTDRGLAEEEEVVVVAGELAVVNAGREGFEFAVAGLVRPAEESASVRDDITEANAVPVGSGLVMVA